MKNPISRKSLHYLLTIILWYAILVASFPPLSMAGEMSRADLKDYPHMQYVAEKLKGELCPFDQYQGPYIVGEGFKSVSYTHLTLPTNREV